MLTPRLQNLLCDFEAQHLLRKREALDTKKSLINFCSNDYLNLASHPNVIKAFTNAAQAYGLGSGASALVSGYTQAHQQLEEKFAEFLQRDKAILFNSGYHANLGVLTTFANRNTTVIADKFCHASLIDGIVLSRAKHKRYRHNDTKHAEELLYSCHSRASGNLPHLAGDPRLHGDDMKDVLLVTESVFSMQGDIANVKRLAAIAKNNHAMLLVDDAHGIGVIGENGGGICDYYQLKQQDVPCLITPFGKALGSFGAIVSGSADIIEALIQCARTYRYSTALPPAICSATVAVLEILAEESWRRDKLHQLIKFFLKQAQIRNLNLVSTDETPIKSIIIGSNKITLDAQIKLAKAGFLISCIRPPTVKQTCIRVSLNCAHTENQIIHLLDLLHECHEYKK